MIYIIITTSINNKYELIAHEHRKQRYIDCIKSSLKFVNDDSRFTTIVVENNGLRNTYLDGLGCDVVYTDNNKYQCPHKGVNELLDISRYFFL